MELSGASFLIINVHCAAEGYNIKPYRYLLRMTEN
jgi:hypothetical protein